MIERTNNIINNELSVIHPTVETRGSSRTTSIIMKGYTTIEQSKKLVELGIDVYTADMHYPDYYFDGNATGPCNTTYKEAVENLLHVYINPKTKRLLPCWSTEALLDILDETIVTDNDDEYILKFGKDGTSYYMFYEDTYRLVNNVIKELDFSCSTLLECAFEMIVKLKELKLI